MSLATGTDGEIRYKSARLHAPKVEIRRKTSVKPVYTVDETSCKQIIVVL